LENEYVRVTVVPALGGRVLRWEDRVTGRRLTYENPVIKPTHWGYRGWWLATGGMEWAFPVEEHGLNEYRPWEYEVVGGDGCRGVRLWDVDDRTGLRVEMTLRLCGGSSALIVQPRITNPSEEAQPLQFWINAMLTLSDGNAPSPSLRFWLPTEGVIVHSTGDGSLPGPRSRLSWPVHEGRDLSRYAEWRDYLGLFAEEARGAAGAYDEAADQGVVRAYPPEGPQGVKLFALGSLPSDLYTDDASRYFELWGGYNRTFFLEDYVTLPPGGALSWTERWYPVHGIGGLDWAGESLAVSLRVDGAEVRAGVYSVRPTEVSLVLWRDGELRGEWVGRAGPAAPLKIAYPEGGGTWILEVWRDGARVATVESQG
jgi:hypothetical protein